MKFIESATIRECGDQFPGFINYVVKRYSNIVLHGFAESNPHVRTVDKY